MHPQPRVRNKTKHTSVVTTGSDGFNRHSPRNGFTAYFAISPAIGLLSPSLANMARQNPVGPARLRKLDAGFEASEPHDFTVRGDPSSAKGFEGPSIVRLRAIRQLTGLVDPPCHPLTSPDAAASTASRPASVTIASRPSVGRDGEDMDLIWG